MKKVVSLDRKAVDTKKNKKQKKEKWKKNY